MEIHTNRSWKKLCTSTWNKIEVDLTCMAMGYFNSSDYYGRWYEDRGNVSETSTNFNCTTTLTKCEESFSKSQFCKGINQLCILESVVRSISVFSFVHPILGTLIDLTIISAIDLTKTSFLALVIDYVLMFTRRLLSKKI